MVRVAGNSQVKDYGTLATVSLCVVLSKMSPSSSRLASYTGCSSHCQQVYSKLSILIQIYYAEDVA